MLRSSSDMIIVGAGLSGLLTAWRCLDVNPDLQVMIIEASDKIAGDHTWSFNLTDVPRELRDWVRPFIAYQWDDYEVKFPKRTRRLSIPYCTGNSETLRACLQPHIKSGRLKVRLKTRVIDLQSDHVILHNEQKLKAKCVLDARGFEENPNVFLGYQKFVGHVIKTKTPHGVERPIIMDATVPQFDGYRFVYCLPFTDTEILVEDTYYTDGPELQSQEVDARIKDYIRDNLSIDDYKVTRREKGVLPITLAVDQMANDNAIGIRGGHYHAVTGYSFPMALNLANDLAHALSTPQQALQNSHHKHQRRERFFRLLNRMLFRAAKPEDRYKVLRRFYGLPQGLVERFYAGQLTLADKVRILIGKPPVPISKALYNFSEKAFIRRERQKANPLRDTDK